MNYIILVYKLEHRLRYSVCVHLSVFEFASVSLKLVRFSLTKGAGVPENYML